MTRREKENKTFRGYVMGILILFIIANIVSRFPAEKKKVDRGYVIFPSDKELQELELSFNK